MDGDALSLVDSDLMRRTPRGGTSRNTLSATSVAIAARSSAACLSSGHSTITISRASREPLLVSPVDLAPNLSRDQRVEPVERLLGDPLDLGVQGPHHLQASLPQ